MAITFDENKGFIAESVEEVRKNVQQVWIDAFKSPDLPELNTAAETPQGQLIDGQTAAIMNKDNELLFLVNQFNPAAASGIFQDALAKIYFLNRQAATATIVACTCTGLQGVTIPAGAVIQTTSGLQLTNMQEGVISSSGSIVLNFQATQTGPIAVGAGTANIIVTQIPGWNTVNNTSAGVVGRNEESQQEFALRIQKSVAINSQGSTDAIYAALANLSGVVAVVILENDSDTAVEDNGVNIAAHSICISIYGGNNNDIAETIYNKKDMGCGTVGNTQISYTNSRGTIFNYNILVPEPYPIGIKVSINNTTSLPSNIQALVQQAVLDNFNGVDGSTPVAMAQTLYATRFIPSIINAGVVSVESVQIVVDEVPSETITFNAAQMPTLDINDINVVIGDM
ncbi:MAG: baseplate J/gp47 family protein [Candidatus Mucispirillum faecigallinarum]|nr:baseplate J/gp47 family protein [Candidatus Mucispirillum faecigallinarum]